MKAMLGIVLLLLISAMCSYWGGNSGQKEEPAYKDYRGVTGRPLIHKALEIIGLRQLHWPVRKKR